MAGIRELKGKFYARVYIYNGNGREKEQLIPLKTADRGEAEVRLLAVEKREVAIKEGIDFEFPWQREDGTTAVKHYTLEDAIADYLKARQGDGLRSSTLDIYERALGHFQTVLGESTPVNSITNQEITQFKRHFQEDHQPATLNINLRSIKTFLKWCQEQEHIESVPKITMVNTGKHMPIYVSNAEFQTICQQVSDHYARAFWFYRATGCRLSEPFYGTINGQFLTIEAETAKSHAERDIHLTPDLLAILREMREKFTNRGGKAKTRIQQYSKQFRQACNTAGIDGKKFHSLRHTFAVRKYLETRDIYQVMKLLGHSTVTTTEIYAKFNIKRLEQDFPDLVTETPSREGSSHHPTHSSLYGTDAIHRPSYIPAVEKHSPS